MAVRIGIRRLGRRGIGGGSMMINDGKRYEELDANGGKGVRRCDVYGDERNNKKKRRRKEYSLVLLPTLLLGLKRCIHVYYYDTE